MKLLSFFRGVINDGIIASHNGIRALPDHGMCECIHFSMDNRPEVDNAGLVHTASFHLEHDEVLCPVLVGESNDKFQPAVLMRISTQSEAPHMRGSIFCVGSLGVYNAMLASRASRRKFQGEWQEGFYVFEAGQKVSVILQNGEVWSIFCDRNEIMHAEQSLVTVPNYIYECIEEDQLEVV